jgi:predicted nucleic acid-binding protein
MWVVDTCVVLDVFENDPKFGKDSAALLEKLLPEGLAVSPVTMVELSAAFDGDIAEQKRFLEGAGISHAEPWTAADVDASHKAWNAYVRGRRKDKARSAPLPTH